MHALHVKNFSLKYTVESGQVFRYEKIDDYYYLVINDAILKIRQKKNILEYESSKSFSKKYLEHFFGLDKNYGHIVSILSRDDNLSKAIARYYGLRLIQQDPEECLISFICSTCCNIPRIKKILYSVSKNFGERIQLGNYVSYSFPSIKKLHNMSLLKNSGTGFRSKFLFKLSEQNMQGFFEKIRRMKYANAKTELMKLPGVGEKVADCVMLFSLGYTEAFPIDVWVNRVMQELYFGNKQTSLKRIRAYANEHFGRYAGYAQQYLFHDRRMRGMMKRNL